MSKQTRVSHPIYNLLPTEIEGFDSLAELALDMRWSWNYATDEVWRQLDPELWEFTQNPWIVLQTVSRNRIERVLADPVFRKNIDGLLQTRQEAVKAPAWFQQTYPKSSLNCVAYFSMEFMLSEALPIYSGGLGNVAGDQLKAASDLGVPVVGVELLYQQGYFRQVLDKDGAQQALYPYNDPGQLPITPLRQANGEWLRLEIDLPGYSVWMRAWQVQFGRVKLYLLDSNDAANFPAHRGITSELYVGGPELRLEQKILLGIGGLRLLGALGIQPEVCHLNEGHAAFAVLERAYSFMQETVQPFEVALSVTRAGNHFTTHTAVAAGFDRFTPALIEQYLGGYAEQKLGLEEYLSRTVFYKERPFTRDQFREFMVAQSQAFPEMIELVGKLKAKYGLKIAVVSNEGRELNTYRIRKFKLDGVVDFFVSSCFVHLRKPDSDIFRLALDIAQVPTEQIIYIENTLMFAQIAEGLGIRSILHTDYPSTCIQLASFGLQLDEGVSHDTR